MKRLLAVLLALLVLAGPAQAGFTYAAGEVSPAEFRTAQFGTQKWIVQNHIWGTHGVFVRTWTDGTGVEWMKRRYHTTEGFGTYVTGSYQFDTAVQRWLLVRKTWCVGNYTNPGYWCNTVPWPW